jgi:hypothetical protein
MTAIDTFKKCIGEEVYLRLDKAANVEVGYARKMALLGDNNARNYYQERNLLPELLDICKLFHDRGLLFLPTDVVRLLFRCKLLLASGTEQEYRQRVGDGLFSMSIRWDQRSEGLETLLEQAFERLHNDITERALVVGLKSYASMQQTHEGSVQAFFDEIFKSLGQMEAFIASDRLLARYRTLQPFLKEYELADATEFFQAPSISHWTKGSREYCRLTSTHWLRTFLNLLRVGAFVYPGQVVYAGWEVKVEAPTNPVFLGDHAIGCFAWNEDTKEAWAKIPDGSLFLSLGYRHLSSIWLDRRTFSSLAQFIIGHKVIFDCIKNPWSEVSIGSVAPTLDLLSSAVQIPDLGAKVLLVYTCLEHLFVPAGTKSNQKPYIVGGLKALKPSLVSWFDDLYKLRCDYAHRGVVIRDDKTMGLVRESIRNTMALLTAKLSVA